MACHRAAPPVHATSGGARGRGGHASAHRAARRAAPAPHLRPRTEPPAPTARACLLAGLLVAVTSVPARRDRPPPEPPPPHPPWPRNRGAAHPSPPSFLASDSPLSPHPLCEADGKRAHTHAPSGAAPPQSATVGPAAGGGWGGSARSLAHASPPDGWWLGRLGRHHRPPPPRPAGSGACGGEAGGGEEGRRAVAPKASAFTDYMCYSRDPKGRERDESGRPRAGGAVGRKAGA